MDCKTCLWYDSKATKIHDASVECLLCIHCKLPRVLRNNHFESVFNAENFIAKQKEEQIVPYEELNPDKKFDY